jgi:N-methylhydantoinase A
MRLEAPDAEAVQAVLDGLHAEGDGRLAEDGFAPARRRFTRMAMARYEGQSSEIGVALPDGDASAVLVALPELFAAEHERTYGFRAPPEEPVELVGLSVVAAGLPERPRLPDRVPPARCPGPAVRRAWFPDGGWREVPVVDRAGLAEGARAGPLIVREYDATCLVPAGAVAEVDGVGDLVIGVPVLA